MLAPLILVLASLSAFVLALQSGRDDWLLVALPCTVASLFLVLRATIQPRRHPARPPLPRRKLGGSPKWMVIDGSNVLHWQDGVASLAPVRAVVGHLTDLGYTTGVVFDANVGFKIGDRYLHHDGMAKELGLPEDQVMVVPKGSQADPVVLAAARDHGARIVSNDRYRDWADAHPEVTKPGHLIRGGYRDGALWLDMDAAETP